VDHSLFTLGTINPVVQSNIDRKNIASTIAEERITETL
jgi:hypothetical protein